MVRTRAASPSRGLEKVAVVITVLLPSLIVNDRWGNPVINQYNAAMLAERWVKLVFHHAP